jgi:GNAT superfamily N-acetyltransferase
VIVGESVAIRPVQTRQELRSFIKFPFALYRDDPNWVPPLIVDRLAFFDRKKNPFYQTAETGLFLAFRDGVPVGRIAACVNHDYNDFHGEKTGVFGFFEAIDDDEVAAALFDSAAEWLKARGMTRMLGPFNFSTNHELGFLAEGYDRPPVVMMTYNPPYYLKLAERWGMSKAKDLLAFWLVQDSPPSDRIRKIATRVRERNRVTVRRLDMSNFENEIELVRQIYNQAWSRNWGFVPLREAEFAHMAKDMKLIVDRDLAFIAEADGRPVGFCLTLPNVYEVQRKIRNGRLFPTGLFRLLWALKVARSIRSTRIVTMGVIHEYQKRGIEAVFYVESFDRGTAKGYESGEISWILEDNDMMIKAAEALGAKRYKTYRIYEKALV